MTARTTYFVVVGGGHFPFDMLRYDHCHPFDSHAARKLGGRDQRALVLACTWEKGWKPTFDRWASFGWSVSFVSDDYFAANSAARALEATA